MKLAYIAQGIALVACQQRLFDEPIVAWKYGPVVRSIYDHFRDFGMNQIKSTDIISSRINSLDAKSEKILNATWETFKNYSGIQLANWTHLPESPWYKEWYPKNAKNRQNHVMDDYLIGEYFKRFLANES